jgi:selenocysteine-specific elongation factor
MKSIVVGTAGHIDHGKSALVRALTGTDPDRLKEEKARGITIDLGFAHAAIGDVNVAFVDVPGHERFVKNMLAGVGGIDLVVLVVAADESVMPQTREHFDICRLLTVPAGIVALTKSDLVDADTLELARMEVRELVAGSFLDGAPIVAVSSKTSDGLDEFRAALVSAAASVKGRAADAVTRLPIDRVFSMKGFGTVVTGTLVSGRVGVEQELTIAPSSGRAAVKVRGVQVHGRKQAEALAGNRTAVNLSGIDVADVSRGQSLVTPGAFEATRIADATTMVLKGAKPLRHGARVRFHQGTDEIIGRVTIVGPASGLRGSAGQAGPALPTIAPGESAFVRLRLERPAILARGDRYILRAYSPPITIAGGVILDPRPPRSAIRTTEAIDRARALTGANGHPIADVADAASIFIAEAGDHGLATPALVSRAGADPRRLDALIDQLSASGAAYRAGDVLVAPAIVNRVGQAVAAVLREHHQKQPLSEGIPREELRDRVFPRGRAVVFDRVLADLEREGAIVAKDRVALATHRVALSPEEERAHGAIERAYREAGLTPPDGAALAASTGLSAGVIDRVMKLLQRQKVLIRVDTLVFHEAALKKLKSDVAALKSAAGAAAKIDVATFKERFGVTRKFAIPLLEYLDRERVTRRAGDARIVL